MPRVTILRGLPGSGKSTFATWMVHHNDAVRVNRDDLRKSLFGAEGILSGDKETAITHAQREVAAAALKAGKDVVVDDTNLRAKYVRGWMEFAVEHGATYDVHPINTPLHLCIQNDASRDRTVGAHVIRTLHEKFFRDGVLPEVDGPQPKTVPEPVKYDEWLDDAILVDIDGTMALMNGRNPFDWGRVGEDLPNKPVVNLVSLLMRSGEHVIFMSGRDESCRDQTLRWLETHVPANRGIWLYMRPKGDTRKDSIVKAELFDQHIRGLFNVKYVLDDRNQVVDMWRSMGLTCLQVAPGDF